MMYFETKLALRHLISGRGQTVLTMVAVSVAVIAIVFIQSLLIGVQRIILIDLFQNVPQVIIRPGESKPEPLARVRKTLQGKPIASRVQNPGPKRNTLANWEEIESTVRRYPHVQLVAPVAQGGADLVRGGKRLTVAVTGGDLEQLDTFFELNKRSVSGKWRNLRNGEIAIGWKLAEEADVRLGDRIRLESPVSRDTYRIGVILSIADPAAIYTERRTAQTLFGLRNDVSRIYLKLDDPFQGDATAKRLALTLPYRVESWTRQNGGLIGIFQAQDGLRYLVSLFSLFGSSFAVASVLIISVTQKSKQIGILKSIGAQDGQILRVFTIEALLIGFGGSLLGAVSSLGLIWLVNQIPNPPDPSEPFATSAKLFDIAFEPAVYATACLLAVVATVLTAVLPARRAARLNPVEVLRG